MAYASDIANRLAAELTTIATFNRHQLAAQVADLAFWLAEVRHCLTVVDGHGRRPTPPKTAPAAHLVPRATADVSGNDPGSAGRPTAPARRVPDHELRRARRALCEAAYRFLVRAFHEGLIPETALRSECASVGLSVEESDVRVRA